MLNADITGNVRNNIGFSTHCRFRLSSTNKTDRWTDGQARHV